VATLREKFRGCLLGGAVGDVAGAVVEAESPGYIARAFGSIDEVLAVDSVKEFSGPVWPVGRYTDDTQMTLCVAEWLIAGEAPDPEKLFARFAAAYEPWRRYGAGAEMILREYRHNPAQWRSLATAAFPHGSYGNGSAMRVAPVGLAYWNDVNSAAAVAVESSRPTHSHPLAYQGVTLQAIAVASATISEPGTLDHAALLRRLRASLTRFVDLMQDTSKYDRALDEIERGLERGSTCAELSAILGTGIEAFEAVPMALYCFLRHRDSFADCVHHAVFIGGDTDTIACMAGSLAGAYLGETAIPPRWIEAVREEQYPPARIRQLADLLHRSFAT
jgi:poly(ADP-ribose) glycohydrolase ARH3